MLAHRIAIAALLSLAATVPAVADDSRTLKVDAVELVAGRETPGNPGFRVEHEGVTYLFASAANKAEFEKNLKKYEVADGGACGKMGALSGLGDAARYHVHAGRIYFFASDGCRETFKKDPSRCIETHDPVPDGTAEQRSAGLAIVDRMISWAGGAEKLRTIKTYQQAAVRKVTRKRADGGTTDWRVSRSLSAEFPDKFAESEAWNDSGYSTIATAAGAVMTGKSFHEVLGESRRQAFHRALARVPIVLLKARWEADFVAVANGEGRVGDSDVEYVLVHHNGATSRFAVEKKSGRPITQAFRGRGSNSFMGAVERTFTEYKTIDGVTLPQAWTATLDAEPAEGLDSNWESIEINLSLPEETFSLKGPDSK